MNFPCGLIIRREFHSRLLNAFVPNHVEPDQHAARALFHRLQELSGRYLILTGAGVSTESGIPDYRSEGVGRYARTSVRPVQFQQVIKSAPIRQRFWARNYVAYPHFANVEPNFTHRILAEWEHQNRFYSLLTQNVDGLHQKAGSQRLIEMHGTMHVVRCLQCAWRSPRSDFQQHLFKLNPDYLNDVAPTAIAPDGDVDLPESKIKDFKAPSCPECEHGIVLPEVIFFGDNMPVARRLSIDEKVDRADGLLILGSTISVQSAFRIVKRMHDRKRFVGIVNIGSTCVDHMASIRVTQSKCSEVLKLVNDMFKNEAAEALVAKYGMHPRNVVQQASIPSTLQITGSDSQAAAFSEKIEQQEMN